MGMLVSFLSYHFQNFLISLPNLQFQKTVFAFFSLLRSFGFKEEEGWGILFADWGVNFCYVRYRFLNVLIRSPFFKLDSLWYWVSKNCFSPNQGLLLHSLDGKDPFFGRGQKRQLFDGTSFLISYFLQGFRFFQKIGGSVYLQPFYSSPQSLKLLLNLGH